MKDITPTLSDKYKILNIVRYIEVNIPTEYDIEHLKNPIFKRLFSKYNLDKVKEFLKEKNKEFDFYRVFCFDDVVEFYFSDLAELILELHYFITSNLKIKVDTVYEDVYYWCLDNYNKIFGDLWWETT